MQAADLHHPVAIAASAKPWGAAWAVHADETFEGVKPEADATVPRAQLSAALYMASATNDWLHPVVVLTNADYLVDAVAKLSDYTNTLWIRADGKDVKNKDLLRQLHEAIADHHRFSVRRPATQAEERLVRSASDLVKAV